MRLPNVTRLTVVLLIVVIATWMAATGAQAQDAHFFISPQGNDRWSGGRAAPNADNTDGPFASLTRAQQAVRKLKPLAKPGMAISVLVRGGRYELKEPIRFGPQDSGTDQTPIVYAAYPGESPVLSGGRKLGGWKRADSDLWQAELPEVKAGSWTFRELSVDGRRCQRPRLPKEGFYKVAGYAGQGDQVHAWVSGSRPRAPAP
jgi:hypothetical protein